MRKSKIFLQRWTEVYQPICLVNQWIVFDEPVISKDQRTRKIQQSDIKVQIYIITSRKNYKQVSSFGNGAV